VTEVTASFQLVDKGSGGRKGRVVGEVFEFAGFALGLFRRRVASSPHIIYL